MMGSGNWVRPKQKGRNRNEPDVRFPKLTAALPGRTPQAQPPFFDAPNRSLLEIGMPDCQSTLAESRIIRTQRIDSDDRQRMWESVVPVATPKNRLFASSLPLRAPAKFSVAAWKFRFRCRRIVRTMALPPIVSAPIGSRSRFLIRDGNEGKRFGGFRFRRFASAFSSERSLPLPFAPLPREVFLARGRRKDALA